MPQGTKMQGIRSIGRHKKLKRYLATLIVCFGLGFVFAACGNGPEDNNNQRQECETHDDCDGDARCSSKEYCVEEGDDCEADTDCPGGSYCADGTCEGNWCEDNDDCSAGICFDGECESGCEEDEDCPDDDICDQLSNECTSPCEDDDDCRDAYACDDSGERPRCVPTDDCSEGGEAHCASYERYVDDGESYICNDGNVEDEPDDTCIPEPPCTSNGDCSEGEICRDGECRAGCEEHEDCLPGEYCETSVPEDDEEYQTCQDGCQSSADCDQTEDEVCVDLQCFQKCESRDDCDTEGEICTGDPRHCQPCTNDNQCYGTEECAMEEGATEGLCEDLPDDCPDDCYGDNADEDNAFEIEEDDLPFEATEDMGEEPDCDAEELNRPIYCGEATGEGDTPSDWFKVTVEPGEVVSAEIQYNIDDGNLDLLLTDESGGERDSARPPEDTSSQDGDGGVERIEYGISPDEDEAVEVFLRVRGSIVESSTPYDLTVDVQEPDPCDFDNTTIDEAEAIDSGTVHEDLEVCGDAERWYELEVRQNELLTLNLNHQQRLGDIDVEIYDWDPDDDTDETGDGRRFLRESATADNEESIDFDPGDATDLHDDKVYARVLLDDGAGSNEFDFYWEAVENECSDELEPNDECDEAAELQGGDSFDDLNICTDDDYYKIDLAEGDEFMMEITYDPLAAAGVLQATLFGPDDCGARRWSARVDDESETERIVRLGAEDRDDDGNAVPYVVPEGEGGTYYILVSRLQGLQVPHEMDVTVE